jgi:hypothetical protein
LYKKFIFIQKYIWFYFKNKKNELNSQHLKYLNLFFIYKTYTNKLKERIHDCLYTKFLNLFFSYLKNHENKLKKNEYKVRFFNILNKICYTSVYIPAYKNKLLVTCKASIIKQIIIKKQAQSFAITGIKMLINSSQFMNIHYKLKLYITSLLKNFNTTSDLYTRYWKVRAQIKLVNINRILIIKQIIIKKQNQHLIFATMKRVLSSSDFVNKKVNFIYFLSCL